MGNIDFRTGDLTARLGGLVGARWKTTPYVRRYVIPANPQTAAQMLVRDAWAFLVSLGRRINSTVLKMFTLPKPKTMSAFNRFMQINQAQIDGGLLTHATVKIATGGLYIEPITAASHDSSNTMVVEWPTTIQGEALASDVAICLVFNVTKGTWGFSTTILRSVGMADVTIAGASPDVMHVWMFFVQGTKQSSESEYFLGTYV